MLKILKGKKSKELEVSPTLCGKLMKKSGNKYQLSLQERYVKLEGNFLRYYKNKHDAQENGSVDLAQSKWVRPYDLSPDCKTFEVHSDEDRTFVFEATDAKARQIWVDSIEMVMKNCHDVKAAAIQTQIINDTPPRVRLFDEEGEDGFRYNITLDVADIYPEDPAFTLKDHIECATDVAAYLDDFVPELQKTATRAARYDILAIVLEIVSTTLTNRLKPILQPTHSFICDAGSLGELHKAIMFLTAYQTQLAAIYCPPSSAKGKPATYCELFQLLPGICERYVNGDPEKRGCVGAAALLVDSCHNILSELLKKPADMVQRHRDGSFFTNAPTEIWSTLHQHLELAAATRSPILQVMIADKISLALKHIIGMITNFVRNYDAKSNPKLKEVELELLCALTNDNAVHIEEIMTVVGNFEMEEIRNRVNEIYDDVTQALVSCGRACLKRLIEVVMADIEEQMFQVFTPEWLEGNQIPVAVATLSDYILDLDTFLMKFWSEKFVSSILEAIILRYTRSVVFRNEKYPQRPPPPIEDAPPIVTETIVEVVKSSFFGFGKKVVQQVVQQVVAATPVSAPAYDPADNTWCFADCEALGRLAQDVNTLNAFFAQRVGQEKAQDYLLIMNEVSLMLQMPVERLGAFALSRISEFPSSAQAIYDTVMACIAIKEEECDPDELADLQIMLRPAVQVASQAAIQLEDDGIPEGPLGLLYLDLVPVNSSRGRSSSSDQTTQKTSLAQRLKDMANIPLATIKKIIDEEDENDENDENSVANQTIRAKNHAEEQASKREMMNNKEMLLKETSKELVEDVMEAMQAQQTEAFELAVARERDLEMQEQEKLRIAMGSINLEGHLDKKSPAHNLWQNRWFKLSTRTQDKEPKFVYTLMWFKKQGGAAIKSADVGNLKSIVLVESNRQLAYNETKQTLMLSSEVAPGEEFEIVRENVRDSFGAMALDAVIIHFSFAITLSDGKEHILRGSKVDKIIKWINSLAMASKCAYDPDAKEWNQPAMKKLIAAKERKKQEEQQRAAERFQRAQLASARTSAEIQPTTTTTPTSTSLPVTSSSAQQTASVLHRASYDEDEDDVPYNGSIEDDEDDNADDDDDDNDDDNGHENGSQRASFSNDKSRSNSYDEDAMESARKAGVKEVLRLETAIEAKKINFSRLSSDRSDKTAESSQHDDKDDDDGEDSSSAGASDSDQDDGDHDGDDAEIASTPSTARVVEDSHTNNDPTASDPSRSRSSSTEHVSPKKDVAGESVTHTAIEDSLTPKAKPPPKRSQLRRSLIGTMMRDMDASGDSTPGQSNATAEASQLDSTTTTATTMPLESSSTANNTIVSPSGARRRPAPPPKTEN